jgi:16S rRNA (cytosine967-C5)-methyltransferase
MTAREIAFDVLTRWKPRAPHASQLLDEWFNRGKIASSERALATELVHGVMRRRETLSTLVKSHINRPLNQVEPGALTLLWMGAYQLAMLSGIPDYAVVNETAELSRRAGKPQWTGFINAVLRSLRRSVTDEFVTVPAANAVPLAATVENGARFRVLLNDVFVDPAQDWPGYSSAAFSFPPWLVARWHKRYDREELTRMGFWFNSPAKLCLRINLLRTTRAHFLDAFEKAGVNAHAGQHPEAVWLEESAFVQRLPGYDEGWFAVQDESAIAAAALLDPQPGQRVLDLCAAPGGKTAHLAALMQNQGRLLATDVDGPRLARVAQTCRRLGVDIVESRVISREAAHIPDESFDRILLDVPCSNTGVLGKRPEVRWRLRPEEISELASIQIGLLRAAGARLASGGRLVYSTCSIEPEENRAVVDAVLRERSDLKLVQEQAHIPGRPADGGYQALLLRNG